MEKLLASFTTLSHLANQVSFFSQVYETYIENEDYLNKVKFKFPYSDIPLAKGISGSLLNYSLIISNSFFDEYNEQFIAVKHPNYANRINNLKKITRPVLNRLKKWINFKDYRNHILAHNFRINGVSIFDKNFQKKNYSIPFTNSEVMLLANMVKIVLNCITLEIPELLENFNFSDTILSKTTFDYNEVDVTKEFQEIWRQINLIREDDRNHKISHS